MVIDIELEGNADLFLIIDALDRATAFARFAQSGKEQSGQDANDPDNDEELDEGESVLAMTGEQAAP